MSGFQGPAKIAPKAHILAKNDNRTGFDLVQLERRSHAEAKSMIGGMFKFEKGLRSEREMWSPKLSKGVYSTQGSGVN